MTYFVPWYSMSGLNVINFPTCHGSQPFLGLKTSLIFNGIGEVFPEDVIDSFIFYDRVKGRTLI